MWLRKQVSEELRFLPGLSSSLRGVPQVPQLPRRHDLRPDVPAHLEHDGAGAAGPAFGDWRLGVLLA